MNWNRVLQGMSLMGLAVLFSCSSGSSSPITMSLASKAITLINTNQVSCEASVANTGSTSPPTPDKPSISFQVPAITVSWSNKNYPVVIQWVAVVLSSPAFPNGKFTYQIAGQELAYDWLGADYCPSGSTGGAAPSAACSTLAATATEPAGIYVSWDSPTTVPTPWVQGTTPPPKVNQCQIFVGGVPLPDKSQNYSGGATIYVYGLYTDGSGNQNPVNTQESVQWSYTGVP